MKNCTKAIEVPMPEGVTLFPCRKCGAAAHILMFNYPASATPRELYGVECDSGKHRIPMAFSSAKSAAHFWNDCTEMIWKNGGPI